MRKKTIKAAIILACFQFLFFLSCDYVENSSPSKEVSFSFVDKIQGSNSGRVAAQDAKKVLVTVRNTSGVAIYTNKELSLYNFGAELLSEPLSLPIGKYTLIDFLVLNGNNEVIYVTPKEGSELAHLVADPLPMSFEVTKDQVTKVIPEVIDLAGYTPPQFGYSTFTFKPVNTVRFLEALFIYDSNTKSLVPTQHSIQVKSGSTILFNGSFNNSTNKIIVRDTGGPYTITVTKSGYSTYTKTFSNSSEIKAFESTPIIIVLTKQSLTNGLVAYYPFNGNANDLSGNNLNGRVEGATLTTDRRNNPNSAYFFDGTDYISVAHNELINFGNEDSFSISLWTLVDARQNIDAGINDIIRKWSGDAQGYPFAISFFNETASPSLQYKFITARYNGSICYGAPSNYSDIVSYNKFYHLVYIKEGTLLKLYINNLLVSSIPDLTSCSTKNNSHMTIGARGQLLRFFTGKIDDVRIYNRAITQTEIAELFNE